MIDGANFHNSIKKNFGIQEKDIDYSKLMASILDDDEELLRLYWYQAKELSHYDSKRWPWESFVKQNGGKNKDRVQKSSEEFIKYKNEREKYYENERKKMDQRRSIYERISVEYPFVEFRYVGELQLDMINCTRRGIKGDDVALAVDMVSKSKNYDVVYLISGDYDYGSAVQVVKDKLKKVKLITFEKGKRPKKPRFPSTHRRLRILCDEVKIIYQSEVPTIPPN